MIRLSRIAVFCLTSLMVTTSQGQAPQTQESMRTPAKASIDADVLAKVYDINQREIGLGLLAQEKGSTLKVRTYGQRMALDYRDDDREIVALAKQIGVQVGPAKSEKSEEEQKTDAQKKAGDRLHSPKGDRFDADFLHAVEQDHREAIAALRNTQMRVSQSMVRNFIDRKLAILQQHLDSAVALESQPSAK